MEYEILPRLVDASQLKEGITLTEIANGDTDRYTITHVEWLKSINKAVVMARLTGTTKKETFSLEELFSRTFFVGYNEPFLLDRQIEQLHAKITELREERWKLL